MVAVRESVFHRARLAGGAPASLVVAAALAAWLLSGAGLGAVALFSAHELAFVLAPGCVLCAALLPRRRGALMLAALGYAVGSVLEVLAFAATAALGVRGALWAYPVVVIGLGVALLRRREPQRLLAWRADARAPWALAVVCIGAIAYISVAYFPFSPLPGAAASVVYIPDLVFHLGVAAEALHHWPITDPKVAGAALPYETFFYMKLAATAQLTHIPLPTLLFRLYLLPPLVAIAALLTCAGKLVSGRHSVGVTAAALFLFVGQLGLDSHDPLVFYNTVFFSLYDSPTYVFGLLLFLGVLIVLLEQLGLARGAQAAPSRHVGGWVLLVLLLIGCAGAKASILPDLLGGLALFTLVVAVRRRRLDRTAAGALALVGAVFLVTYALIYHGESGGLSFDVPGSIRSMTAIGYAHAHLAGAIPGLLFWAAATVVGIVGFCGATLAGIPFALRSPGLRQAGSTAFLLALLAASFGPFLLLTQKGGSQNFFTYYGICAACVVSAQGLVLAWDRAGPITALRAAGRALAASAWVIALIAAAVVPYALRPNLRVGTALYLLWVGLPLGAVVVVWIACRGRPAGRAVLPIAAAGAVVLTGALDTPLHVGAAIVPALRSGRPLHAGDSAGDRGLTPGLQRALAWIRSHTPADAVLAVNNQFSDNLRLSPTYYYYSAFGERRVFLEGWVDTIAAAGLRNPVSVPFPWRLRLNDAVFSEADPQALSVMEHRYGVRYLFVDRVHGSADPRLAALGHLVFRNSAAIVYRVRPIPTA